MKKLFSTMLIALLCAGALAGAGSGAEGSHDQERKSQRDLAYAAGTGAGSNGMVISTSDNDHLILSGPKDTVAGFEEIVKQLDVVPAVKTGHRNNGVYDCRFFHAGGQRSTAHPGTRSGGEATQGHLQLQGFRLLESFRAEVARRGERSNEWIPAAPREPACRK